MWPTIWSSVALAGGLAIAGGGLYLEHTLLAVVRRRAPEASPMHRLGRDTSGVVLFARSGAAAAQVQAAFRERRVGKTRPLDSTAPRTRPMSDPRRLRFAIIGAGMAGVLSAIRLRDAGYDDWVVYEKGDRVGRIEFREDYNVDQVIEALEPRAEFEVDAQGHAGRRRGTY